MHASAIEDVEDKKQSTCLFLLNICMAWYN